jgi:hypothetical protein
LTASKTFGVPSELLDSLATIDVPHLDFEISTTADNGVAPHLHSVDRASVSSNLLQHCTSGSIPDAYRDVLRTGHNIMVVKGKVKHCRTVLIKSHEWPVIVFNIVDNARAVRGAGD